MHSHQNLFCAGPLSTQQTRYDTYGMHKFQISEGWSPAQVHQRRATLGALYSQHPSLFLLYKYLYLPFTRIVGSHRHRYAREVSGRNKIHKIVLELTVRCRRQKSYRKDYGTRGQSGTIFFNNEDFCDIL